MNDDTMKGIPWKIDAPPSAIDQAKIFHEALCEACIHLGRNAGCPLSYDGIWGCDIPGYGNDCDLETKCLCWKKFLLLDATPDNQIDWDE